MPSTRESTDIGASLYYDRTISSLPAATAIMAPSFDQLSDHDFDPEDDEIDFSDLQEQYEVHMEQGLDTFVVCNRPSDNRFGC